MEDIVQIDETIYGPDGGPREYGEMSGRLNGGGWVTGPFAFSDFDGMGVVMPPPGADGQKNLTNPGFVGNGPYGADPLLDAVNRSATMVGDDFGWY